MLFGPVNKTVNKYRDIEKRYKENLDNWVCNLYFSVRRKISRGKDYRDIYIGDDLSLGKNANIDGKSPYGICLNDRSAISQQ